ncbi:hypothetical protein BpHYR1_014260 [Brachionus plicatilis]|uniref:Uncharacterized protein n=1 Tax=Brachionus plicatilis TaxID=10195 RepID=A0A3M7SVU3_BRAPC|nr:hypothetical protein BpHYR1_014260 [Brachionus plicatilis]
MVSFRESINNIYPQIHYGLIELILKILKIIFNLDRLQHALRSSNLYKKFSGQSGQNLAKLVNMRGNPIKKWGN